MTISLVGVIWVSSSLKNILHQLHFLLCSLHGKYIAFNYRENSVKQSVDFSSPQEKRLLIGQFLHFYKENRTNKRGKTQTTNSLSSFYILLRNSLHRFHIQKFLLKLQQQMKESK